MPYSLRRSIKLFFCLLLLHFSMTAQAQQKAKVGMELDVLPYVTGGYFGAVWIGKEHLRARALYAYVHMPDFVTPDGFSNNTIRSFALLGDYFLKKEQVGFWVGGGLVFWDGTIQTDLHLEEASYHSFLINGSMGYAWPLNAHFYLSPWAGLSLRTGGDQQVSVDGETFKPRLINPEASLKVGFVF